MTWVIVLCAGFVFVCVCLGFAFGKYTASKEENKSFVNYVVHTWGWQNFLGGWGLVICVVYFIVLLCCIHTERVNNDVLYETMKQIKPGIESMLVDSRERISSAVYESALDYNEMVAKKAAHQHSFERFIYFTGNHDFSDLPLIILNGEEVR